MSNSQPALSIADICATGERLRDDFEHIFRQTAYEMKGIFYSEALFVAAGCTLRRPRRIIESGRARGQSTVLLAQMFPDLEILSIEFNVDSPDRQVAEARLAMHPNVRLLCGDSTRLIPELIRKDDAVLIDGPKHFRALRLALRLVDMNLATLIFLHDLHRGAAERRFLVRRFPQTLFSDHENFVRQFSDLDQECWRSFDEVRPEARNTLFGGGGQWSYGPTFACIPGNAGPVGWRHWIVFEWMAAGARLRRPRH